MIKVLQQDVWGVGGGRVVDFLSISDCLTYTPWVTRVLDVELRHERKIKSSRATSPSRPLPSHALATPVKGCYGKEGGEETSEPAVSTERR